MSVEFFELTKLDGATAKQVAQAVFDVLKSRDSNLEAKVMLLGTDGCSTMMGKDNGVGKLVRGIGPHSSYSSTAPPISSCSLARRRLIRTTATRWIAS